MCKFIFVSIVLLSLSILANQNLRADLFEYENSFVVDKAISEPNRATIRVHKNKIAIFNTSAEVDSLNLKFTMQINSKVYYLDIPNRFKKKSYTLVNFAIDDSLIVINDFQYLYVFKYQVNNDSYVLWKSLTPPESCVYVDIDGDKIITYNCNILSDNADKMTKAYSIVYSIPDETFRETDFPMSRGMRLSVFANIQLISYDYSQIIIQDAVQYRVLFYNLDGTVRDSIIRDTDTLPVPTTNMKQGEKSDLMTKYKNSFSLEYARMIDANTLLASYAVPSGDGLTKNKYFDVWKHSKDKGWILAKSDIEMTKPDSNAKFNPDLFRIRSCMYFEIDNNKIYTIEHFPFEIDENLKNLTNKEIDDKLNNFLKSNEPVYRLIVRKIN